MRYLLIFLFFAFSVSVIGQTNSKDLKELAKKENSSDQNDSITKVRELELTAQKCQDSIDIVQGRKPKPYSWLIKDCLVFRTNKSAQGFPKEFERSDFYTKYKALCNNDILAYFGKYGLDELDLSLYKKSDQFKSDMTLFKKKKNEKLALIYPLKGEDFSFHGDGITIKGIDGVGWWYINENLQRNYRGFRELVIPFIPADKRTNSLNTFFKSNNTNALLKVRDNKNTMGLLYIFKPGISVMDEKTEYGSHKMYISYPVGIYLINLSSGEIALDLSPNLRKPNFKLEKKKIEAAAAAKYKKNRRNGNSNSLVTKDVCSNCLGTGISVTPFGKRQKCMACNGRGYIVYRW